MANPPSIAFTIPFGPAAFKVVVNANGVMPDGTNTPTPDTTSALVFSHLSGNAAAYSAAVDPADNRRVIVTPGILPPGSGSGTPWSFKVSVAGRAAFVTVSGSTAASADLSGVTYDGNGVSPA